MRRALITRPPRRRRAQACPAVAVILTRFCVPLPALPAHAHQSGISHSLDFPIDIDEDMPPALDVLIASCLPHAQRSEYAETETLFYPPNLPLTATLELANHPILEAVRNTLFAALPTGHYLTAVRDKLEVWPSGNAPLIQPRPIDNRVATILITLPVKFKGGSLVVRGTDGREERFHGRGGRPGDLEWTAFMSDCEYEIQTVRSGCRVTIAYAVQVQSFGPAGIPPSPLISPSDAFLDSLSPVLNMSRRRSIAFYLTGEYGVNPGEVVAESLVPNVSACVIVWLDVTGTDNSPLAQGRRLDTLSCAETVPALAGTPLGGWRVRLACRPSGGDREREPRQPNNVRWSRLPLGLEQRLTKRPVQLLSFRARRRRGGGLARESRQERGDPYRGHRHPRVVGPDHLPGCDFAREGAVRVTCGRHGKAGGERVDGGVRAVVLRTRCAGSSCGTL